MKRLEIPSATLIAIEEQLARSNCSGDKQHRLHGLLLICKGQTCLQVAEALGQSRRTIQRWVRQYELNGFDGLKDGAHSGRPRSLSEDQWERLGQELKQRPPGLPRNRPHQWDSRQLVDHLRVSYGVELGIRQCQRILKLLCHRRRTRASSERQCSAS